MEVTDKSSPTHHIRGIWANKWELRGGVILVSNYVAVYSLCMLKGERLALPGHNSEMSEAEGDVKANEIKYITRCYELTLPC